MYFGSGMVSVDEQFEADEYGVYSIVSSTSEIIYVPSGDGKTLTKIDYVESAASDTEEAETKEEATESEDKTAETEAVADTEEKIEAPEANGVDPGLKAFLDSYEAYMDEYCEFMENYDANDVDMLLKYADMMAKYADFAEKADAYNPDTMSAADSAYYLEVMNRANVKLAKVAYAQ